MQSVSCLAQERNLPLLAKGQTLGNEGRARNLAHGGFRMEEERQVANFCPCWKLPGPLSLECGLPGGGPQREGSWLSIVGLWDLGPQKRLRRGTRASESSRTPGEGLLAELAQAQWSRLAPMQEA